MSCNAKWVLPRPSGTALQGVRGNAEWVLPRPSGTALQGVRGNAKWVLPRPSGTALQGVRGNAEWVLPKPSGTALQASGRGARESACAGLIYQLQRCRFDPRIARMENTDTAIVGDWSTGVGGHHALNC